MPSDTAEPRGPAGRERLLATARTLFTRHGAANVGINEVTAEAGVARMTLYNNFPSKDALVTAVYRETAEAELNELRRIAMSSPSDEAAVLAMFDHFDRRCQAPGSRGCPLIQASLQAAEPEGPVYDIVQRYKRDLRDHALSLLDEARADRSQLADQILLLLDGAVTEAYLGGVAAPFTAARRAATVLLRIAD